MSGVVRRALTAAVALLVVLATGTVAAGPVAATTPRETIRLVSSAPGPEGRPTTAATAIVPGTVNRASLSLRATYAVRARLDVGSRALSGYVVVTAQNRSGAGID